MISTAETLPAFDLMRYERLNPGLPLGNGRKPNLRSKEDNNQFNNHDQTQTYSLLKEKKLLQIKSISPSPYSHFCFSTNPSPDEKPPPAGTSPSLTAPRPVDLFHHENNGESPVCRDVLLQWGHNKRPRCSRSESRHVGEADPSRNRSNRFKLPRRCSVSSTSTGHDTRREPRFSSALPKNGGERLSLPSPPEETCHNKMASAASPSLIGYTNAAAGQLDPAGPLPVDLHVGSGPVAEKMKAEQTELPRIYVSLSRKEKEEDFFAMKGAKLPQRPKKRAKNIDRSLQYCFPGMWLSDLTRARYEVRERKCVTKKRRGLKKIDGMDSGDSE